MAGRYGSGCAGRVSRVFHRTDRGSDRPLLQRLDRRAGTEHSLGPALVSKGGPALFLFHSGWHALHLGSTFVAAGATARGEAVPGSTFSPLPADPPARQRDLDRERPPGSVVPGFPVQHLDGRNPLTCTTAGLELDARAYPDVPLAVVARDGRVEQLVAASRSGDLAKAGAQVGVRIRLVRMIEQVHEIAFELQFYPLGQPEALVQTQVGRPRAWPNKRIGGAVAIGAGSGYRECRRVQKQSVVFPRPSGIPGIRIPTGTVRPVGLAVADLEPRGPVKGRREVGAALNHQEGRDLPFTENGVHQSGRI